MRTPIMPMLSLLSFVSGGRWGRGSRPRGRDAPVRGHPDVGVIVAVLAALLVGLATPVDLPAASVIMALPLLLVAWRVAPPYWSLVTGITTMIPLLIRATVPRSDLSRETLPLLALMTGACFMGRVLIARARAEAQVATRMRDVRDHEHMVTLAAIRVRTERMRHDQQRLDASVAEDMKQFTTVASNLVIRMMESAQAGQRDVAYDHERRLLRVIRRMAMTAQDLADLTQLAEGQDLAMAPTATVLPTVAEQVADQIAVEAQTFHVRLVITVSPDVPACWCDPRRAERVLWCLIGNAFAAVKQHGHGGTITVTITAEAGGMVRCAVADPGVGMAPADLDQVRHRLVRPLLPGAGGDGLGTGLTLAAQLIAGMGGTLRIASPGLALGTVADFTLPAAAADPCGPVTFPASAPVPAPTPVPAPVPAPTPVPAPVPTPARDLGPELPPARPPEALPPRPGTYQESPHAT